MISAIIYLLLAVKENVWCWLFAMISTVIYTALFWNVSLLMDSALNVYYMAMAVFGWYQWTRGGVAISSADGNDSGHSSDTGSNGNGCNNSNGNDTGNNGKPLPLAVRSMSTHQHGWVITITAVLTVTSGYLLSEHSSAVWPYVDSFTTWASVLTTYLVTQKYLQNWLYWIVIDAVSIPLYMDRGLTLTAALFVFYVVIAVFGYFKWRQHLPINRQADAA